MAQTYIRRGTTVNDTLIPNTISQGVMFHYQLFHWYTTTNAFPCKWVRFNLLSKTNTTTLAVLYKHSTKFKFHSLSIFPHRNHLRNYISKKKKNFSTKTSTIRGQTNTIPPFYLSNYRINIYIHITKAQDVTTEQKDKFSFQALDKPLGIYLEQISTIQFFSDTWNIIYHIDLSTLNREYHNIRDNVDKLDTFCQQLQLRYNFDLLPQADQISSKILTRECGAELSQIKMMLEGIEEFNIHWFHGTTTRNRRAPFNFVTILNKLFGTLSQEQAEEYLEQFRTLEQKAIRTEVVLEQQTTFITTLAESVDQIHQDNLNLQHRTSE